MTSNVATELDSMSSAGATEDYGTWLCKEGVLMLLIILSPV